MVIPYRKLNETEQDYKLRVYKFKQACGNEFTWLDIAEVLNEELGYDYSESKYRKESYSMLEDNYMPEAIVDPIEEIIDNSDLYLQALEVKKERIKLSDERTQINAIARKIAREDVFKELAIEAVKEMESKKVLERPKIKISTPSRKVNRHGILCIGDWHYGLDVDLFYNKYSPEIATQRLNKLVEKVLEIGKKEQIEELTIINLGDMISGRIHLPLRLNSRIDVVTQTMQVSEIIAEFLTTLSFIFPINYYSVEDNHSRVEPNKKDSINTEAFSRIIDWYLKERLRNNENIKFCENEFGDDIASLKVYNHNIIAIHGDKDPQRGIVDKLNSYLQTHVDMIISAHMHHFSADENNETEFYCNGSLMGQDQYANDLRLNSKPSQLMFISTPDNFSEVLYKIKL